MDSGHAPETIDSIPSIRAFDAPSGPSKSQANQIAYSCKQEPGIRRSEIGTGFVIGAIPLADNSDHQD